MDAKKESCSYGDINIKDDHKDLSEEQESSLSLENLNLEPKKKLLVMNLNGFLLHRVHVRDKEALPKSRTDHYKSLNFLLFKRPFSEEFMKFCLEIFEVGIWSSAQDHNVHGALTYAIGEESKNKLLFIWNQDHCRNTGFKSVENKEKPLFFKPLKYVWEYVTKGGPYSLSNTLLIDDKPYKAFLNPPNTAIFLKSYDPENKEDKSLDPNGELCKYLKGVAEAEDVQSYVKTNAFGLPAITNTHTDWIYYSRIRYRAGPKKLLIMNLNGFLIRRVYDRDTEAIPNFRKADYRYGAFFLYKREFSEEFMKFCLERFEVGIWSSAKEYNVTGALSCAIGQLMYKLLFIWDQKKCTDSGFKCKENREKPLFFKEVNKVWDKVKRGGPYSSSNTLMIGDKPYMSFLNPENTAIFTKPYDPEDSEDRALDPNGELCEYLKGVAEAEDVQCYVKNNPFGEPAITSSHPDWKYYFKVRYYHDGKRIRSFR
ncbi:Haloacid dehalogenase hydrolase (HAD) superfamily protein [Trifolium repens]|nr:Haloacid dehalogenase hydrolase (HAD) superfamily protein [Trifolium repens]